MEENDYKVIDLFAGSGGSALGFSQAGFTIAVAVDIDGPASKTFSLNFPEATVLNTDIREIGGKDLLKAANEENNEKIVLIACPPCQGFSSARRKSEASSDPRNNLILEFVRIVSEIMPIAFVMENVPGLAKGIGKELFDVTLTKLRELGYQTVHNVVDCADYGVPQRRKRLVLMGTKNPQLRLTFPKVTNQNPDLKGAYLPSWKTVKDTIDDLNEVAAGEKDNNDIMHVSANLSETNIERLNVTPHDGGDRTSWPDALILQCHRNKNGFRDVYGRMHWNRPSPTITGGCAMISKGRFGHPEQNRAITLREAARLQTFPDTFRFIGNFGQIAKQLGNAVPPLLAKRIADSLVKSFDDLKISSNVLSDNSDISEFPAPVLSPALFS